jgi:hypothetical protein
METLQKMHQYGGVVREEGAASGHTEWLSFRARAWKSTNAISKNLDAALRNPVEMLTCSVLR